MNIQLYIKVLFFSLIINIFNCTSQIKLNKISEKVPNNILTEKNPKSSLSNEEIVKGLKEALTIGVEKGSNKASKVNGFLNNEAIRLPFPPDAQKVKEVCLKFRLNAKVEEFEETLNKAAEEACKTAATIFKNAVLNMSVKDGFQILKGEDNAATNYLKEQTTNDLYTLFFPEVKKAIEKVKLTSYWEPLTKKYNQTTRLSGNEPVNTDLNKYVTEKAIEGIFHLIEIEEKAIRKDPLQRTSDLLKKVFGN
tara:strand:+ start:2973 stop:3725 length:753 start_codon:yes stop_codon:yes gene_type:complete